MRKASLQKRMGLHYDVFDHILDAVTRAARQRHASGFLIVAETTDEVGKSGLNLSGLAFFSPVNRNNVLRIGVKGKKDANFAAIAGAKLGKVLAHKKHSGGKARFFGELEFMGGRIGRSKRFLYLFSGAPQEIDDRLMQIAEKAHMEYFR